MYTQKPVLKNLKTALFGALIMAMILPLSMTSEYATASSPSLKEQLNSGVAISDLLCSNDRVLVIRDNGNPACVAEKSAHKLGWIPFDQITHVLYQGSPSLYILYEDDTSGPFSLDFESSLSGLPKVGETITLSVNATQIHEVTRTSDRVFFVAISDNLEFVNIPDDQLGKAPVKHLDYAEYVHLGNMDVGDTKSLDLEIRATGEGDSLIRVYEVWPYSNEFKFVVGEHRTLLSDDYYKINPDKKSPEQKRILAKQAEEDAYEQKRQSLIDAGECFYLEEYDNYFCPDHPSEHGVTTFHTKPADRQEALEQAIALNMTEGLTEDEIEELIDALLFDPNLSTQSFSNHDDEFSISGRLTTDIGPLVPVNAEPDSKRLYGVEACLWEADFAGGIYTKLQCRYTSNLGFSHFSGISLPDSSQDGTLDVFIIYSTNGERAYVAPAQTNGNRELSDTPYIFASHIMLDLDNSDERIDTNLLMGDPQSDSRHNRAFWIVDAVTTANDWLEDKFDLEVEKRVNIGWQHNSGTLAEFGISSNGAVYYPNSDTMYLSGYQGAENTDDSNERFVVIHEYGHFVMDQVYDSFPVSGCPSPHRFYEPSALNCAWTEGWSHVLATLVDENPTYPRNTHFIYDLENATSYDSRVDLIREAAKYNSTHPYLGQLTEGRVAAAVWDILDSDSESDYDIEDGIGQDDLNQGFSTISNIFENHQPDNFEEFYDSWESQNYPRSQNVMRLHYMDFAFPDTTDPTVTITQPVDSTHYYVHEVWEFTVGGIADDNRELESISATLNGVELGDMTSGDLTSWEFDFAASRTSNTFIVTATDEDGNTATDTLFIIIDKDDPPNPPERPSKPDPVFVSSNEVTIQWTAPASDSPVTGYDIYRQASPKELIATVDGSTTSYTDGTVEPDTTYRYSVIAKSANGDSQESEQIEISTPSGLPGISSNFNGIVSDGNTVTISWDAPVDDGGSPITGYNMEFGSTHWAGDQVGEDTTWYTLANLTGTDTTFVHHDAPSYSIITYKIFAANEHGVGPAYDRDDFGNGNRPLSVLTTYTEPGIPENLAVMQETDSDNNGLPSNMLSVLWDEPENDGHHEGVSSYEILYKFNDEDDWYQGPMETEDNFATVTNDEIYGLDSMLVSVSAINTMGKSDSAEYRLEIQHGVCGYPTIDDAIAFGGYNVIDMRESGLETIDGTGSRDLILAPDHGVTIHGRNGPDCIIGGDGNDTIYGHWGKDIIYGRDGDDTIYGLNGSPDTSNDRKNDHDTIFGGDGNDTIFGGQNADVIYGQNGADRINGNDGHDAIYGGSGNDVLHGQDHKDRIFGGYGNDSIHCGGNTDKADGGPGTDSATACETRMSIP